MRLFPSAFLSNINKPNAAMHSFISELSKIYNESFPLKFVSVKKHKPPWVTAEIKSAIKKKQKLLKLSRSGVILRRSYATYRNVL
jgi:hypothetical protein